MSNWKDSERNLETIEFSWIELASSTTDANIMTFNNDSFPCPRRGYIKAVSYVLSEALTAGAVTIRPSINGTEVAASTSLNHSLDSTSALRDKNVTSSADPNYTFQEDDYLQLLITSDASLAPNDTITLSVYVVVVYQ